MCSPESAKPGRWRRLRGEMCIRDRIIPLLLTSVLAAIPVALPATFTLAASFGARSLVKLGVLPTRLSAIDEAATIDVLCSDKTGTLTCNQLSVTSIRPMPGFDEAHVLGMATLASSEGGQDSVDAAIRSASSRKPASDLPKPVSYTHLDVYKRQEQVEGELNQIQHSVGQQKGNWSELLSPCLLYTSRCV